MLVAYLIMAASFRETSDEIAGDGRCFYIF